MLDKAHKSRCLDKSVSCFSLFKFRRLFGKISHQLAKEQISKQDYGIYVTFNDICCEQLLIKHCKHWRFINVAPEILIDIMHEVTFKKVDDKDLPNLGTLKSFITSSMLQVMTNLSSVIQSSDILSSVILSSVILFPPFHSFYTIPPLYSVM